MLAVSTAFAGCGPEAATPETELRLWIAEAETEAEEGDRGALMSRIAEGYADARGNRRSDVDRLLRYLFLRQPSISLLTSVGDIRIFGDSAAEVALTVGMAGAKGGLRLSAEAWRFELELERIDGDWLLIGARWGRLGDELR